jgi:hypothetical protein
MAVEVAPYTGWRPRSMRKGRGGSGDTSASRNQKRSRLGNRLDRNFFCWAKAPKSDPERYARLSKISDKLNGR